MAWDYDKEEEHLDEMSEKGWQLKREAVFQCLYQAAGCGIPQQDRL